MSSKQALEEPFGEAGAPKGGPRLSQNGPEGALGSLNGVEGINCRRSRGFQIFHKHLLLLFCCFFVVSHVFFSFCVSFGCFWCFLVFFSFWDVFVVFGCVFGCFWLFGDEMLCFAVFFFIFLLF